MLILRASFFFFFIITAILLTLPGKDTLRRGVVMRSNLLLTVLTVLGLVGLFAYQAKWQLFGGYSTDLMRFMRRHDNRPTVAIRRGSILDRNGSVLAIDDPEGNSLGRRRYPLGAAAAHVIGYFDPRYGLTGIEKTADSWLTGIGSSHLEELGRLGRSIVDSTPVEGRDLKLTLDARLQRSAAKAMKNNRGAVVVLNPKTGELLALFSAPGFDPTEPGGYYGDTDDAPFMNRAVQGKYPPGSTFKVAMAAIAADMGIAPVLDCSGEGFRADRTAKPIRDSEFYSYQRNGRVWRGFGKIGLQQALIHSSNVYFAQLAHHIPAASFNDYVARMGIGSPTPLLTHNSQSYSASSGAIPKVKDVDKRMRSQLAIGQGAMAVSPLDVAKWTSIVAAGGILHSPRLELNPSSATYPSLRVISKTAALNVERMMRGVIQNGTGKGANIPGLGLCGKTGTAQNPRGDDHSWFTCFTTTTTPRLVVTVIVENGGFGSKAALPIARSIIEDAERFGIIVKTGDGK